MDYPAAYLEGIRLFNLQQFWHAHEAWETAWQAETDPELRLFYKSVIQVAAALVHWQRQNPRGLALNWAKARAKLMRLPPIVLGIDLRHLVQEMDRFAAIGDPQRDPPRIALLHEIC